MFIYFLNILHFAIYPYIGYIKILQNIIFETRTLTLKEQEKTIRKPKKENILYSFERHLN